MNDFESEKRSSPEARARRIRYVRESVLGVSREQFSIKSRISASSLQNWEQERNKGLTEAGARRLVSAFREEGADCTVEWLLYEIGEKPTAPFSKATMKELLKSPDEEIISKELQLYHDLNPRSIDTVVADDGMSPIFWPGDYLAGKRYAGEEVKKTIGLPCIVELETGELLVRMLEIGDQDDKFNLYCANPNALTKKIYRNVDVKSSAPVLWMRRRTAIRR
jgi:DNA-binding transcriptional regulator YiaG